ncbi:hypothetical protein H5410_021387, partial [Solanum commersonii]
SLETSIIPPSITGDVQRDDTIADESKIETDEERIEVNDDEVYNDLVDLENAMDENVCHMSLRDTATGGSSGGGPSEVTLSTEDHVQIDILGTDAQISRTTLGIDDKWLLFVVGVLSREGKYQVVNEKEQSAHRRTISQSSTILPIDQEREDAEGQS